MPEPRRPQTFIPLALVAGLAVLAVGGARLTRIPVADADCEALEHDADPWIVAPESIPGFCAPESADDRWTRRTSAFETVRVDDFQQIDASYWDRMDSTFYCNEAQFTPDNVSAGPDGLQIRLTGDARGDRAYSSGDLATKDSPDANYLYGRFETVMKPAKGSGVLSAFFLYRYDPWQEIDTEFLGQDTTRILLNVYYNPGQPGDKYNYGYRGTPVLVDLGFDASEDFHTYAVEWDVDQIRWFVDGKLVHYRDQGRPTPIPDLPMRLHMNLWPMCSEELAGPFAADSLPMQAGVKSVMISRRVDSPLQSILSVVDAPFVEHTGSAWQDDADWIRR